MNVDAWSENDAKTIGDRSEKVELLTRFRRCYNTVDMKKVDIDNCLSCYNIDSDCKVHPSTHIHQHLMNQQICKVNSLKYDKNLYAINSRSNSAIFTLNHLVHK